MLNSMKYIFIAFAVLSTTILFSQDEKKLVREGNNLFEDENYSEAEIVYRKALTEKPTYYKGNFNLGDAMYKQENYEESGKLFGEVAESSTDESVKASSFYNLGNTLLSENKFKESIEAYKKSLRINPNDIDAKYNLEYARKKLNEQEQQQQNQDQDQDQDNKDQDQENKDQDKKDQDKKDQDKENQDKEDQKDQDQKDQDKKDKEDQKDNKGQDQKKDGEQKPQPQQISKQDAQKMLDALKNDEKKTLQKLQLEKAKGAKSTKTEIDW